MEILKQLYLKSRILILDEPTAVLTPQEAEEALGLLREMVLAKKLSIILITHKFKQVTDFCDEITVMRRGKFAGRGRVKDLTVEEMSRMMLGEQRTVVAAWPNPRRPPGRPVLQIINLVAEGDNGLPAVRKAQISMSPEEKSSESPGCRATVSGNSSRSLADSAPPSRARCVSAAKPYRATRAEMFDRQVFALPEEPLRNACVPNMTVSDNLALRSFDRPPQSRWGGLLNRSAIRRSALEFIQSYNIRTPSPETPVRNLSGGNVQKTVLAREISSLASRLLIAANPCFGLDFNAVEFIHSQITAARNRGVAVLLVSEDLDELLALADRIVVMAGGAFVYETAAAAADINAIGRKMAGH